MFQRKVFEHLIDRGHASIEAKSVIVSPDGRRLAYVARAGQKCVVVLNGQEGKDYDDIRHLTFSPNGQHIAYVAERSDSFWAIFAILRKFTYGKFVVVDGQAQKQHDRIEKGSLVLSLCGQSLAYMARAGKNRFVVVGGPGNVITDGAGAEYQRVLGRGAFGAVRGWPGRCAYICTQDVSYRPAARPGPPPRWPAKV